MYKKNIWHAVLLAGHALLAGPISLADTGPSDEQIRQQIVAQSLRAYPGNCPCPYNVDRAGRRCGQRSAWNRPGGYTPICFTSEVSDEQVREFKARVE